MSSSYSGSASANAIPAYSSSGSNSYVSGKYSGTNYAGGKYSAGVNYSSSNYGLGNYGKGFSMPMHSKSSYSHMNFNYKLPSLDSLIGKFLGDHILPAEQLYYKSPNPSVAPYKAVSDYLEFLIKSSFSKSSKKDDLKDVPVVDLGSILKKYELEEVKPKLNPYLKSSKDVASVTV